jgi:ammonium transporter, Amt family
MLFFRLLTVTLLYLGISSVGFAQEAQSKDFNVTIAKVWVLGCAALVFFMQVGFVAFEVGCVRKKNAGMEALKGVGDWLISTVFFFLVGFGFMFGASASGFIGTSFFMPQSLAGHGDLGWEFYLFQLTFAGTAATIVSGATAERVGFRAYLLMTVMMVTIVYPVFGHWVWGSTFLTENKPFLANMGFIDFAGASVVHSVGAWTSLVGIWFVGPRIGRYRSDGSLAPMDSNSSLWSCIGTLMLFFSWWAFNGGSVLKFDDSVASIIFNTNLAGSAAGLAAFGHCSLMQKSRDLAFKTMGGILGGLVAITACCHIVTPGSAFLIGLSAGIIHNWGFDLTLRRWKLDDVVGAIPVHGFCGTWGLLCVALFGEVDALKMSMVEQLGVQCIGIVVCFVWTVVSAFILFAIIKILVGVRVSAMHEINGLSFEESEESLNQ